MSARTRSKATPRRKAGSMAPKAKRVIAFRLVVEDQEMLVRYTPNYFGGELAQGHFEFLSPHKPPRRIAISETGYLSHFAPMEQIKRAKSPEIYAREVVLSILNTERAPPLRKPIQLTLF